MIILFGIIFIIIVFLFFSTAKLKVDNLIFSNNVSNDKPIVKLQIYLFKKIKIAEIRLKNNKIKKEYIRQAINKMIEKKEIFLSKKERKRLNYFKIKIEKFNYKFKILFGEGIAYYIELEFKISFKLKNLIMHKV